MRSFRLIAVVLSCLVPAVGCGVFGGDDLTTAGQDHADGAVQADTSETLSASGVDAPVPLAPDPGATGSAPAGSSTGGPPNLAPSQDAQEPGSIEERIDVLIAAQSATQQRLDSLVALLGEAAVIDTMTMAGRGSQPGEVLGEAGSQVRNFGVGILWSIAIVFLFNYLIRAVAWALDRMSERSAKRRLFFKGMVPIVRIVLWLFAGYLIVRVVFQVDAQGIVAGAAALGVAIGFAAQDLLKNLFGGIILVFDQPFQVGDKIRVGETYGEVTSIGLRSTRIVTADDNRVSVPNAQVVDQQVANANAGELNCQVVIDLYLPGDVDEARAKKIAFEAAVGSRYVYLNKPVVVLVRDELHRTVFTRVRVKAYVLDPRHEFLFESDVTERARAGFRAAGMMGGERVPPWWGRPRAPVEQGADVDSPTAEVAREGG
ncbi:MAG: mechanosensitive ion channel family protein [Gemmatimonadota bacterium]